MKGKIFSILLLICFAAPISTTYFVLKIQKKRIRKEVKWKMIAGIDPSELVLLKITEKEESKLKWKHSKEFEYKGEMYDIVKSEVKNDTTLYWCWWDYEETMLNKQLDSLLVNVLGKNPQNQKSQKNLQHFLKSLFFVEKVENKLLSDKVNQVVFPSVLNYYNSLENRPPTPPPELL